LGDFETMSALRLTFWVTAAVCGQLLCSCATRDSVCPVLPAEAAFNEGAGSGGLWAEDLFVTLRLESGEELLFNVDTGAPVTVLDKSLVPRLAKRLSERQLHYAWEDRTAGAYRAPRLYIGNTQLRTGGLVWTDDTRRFDHPTNTHSGPVMGILGMDCMGHYAIQLDFAGGKMRFLESDHLGKEGLGKAFPLTVNRVGHVTVRESFTGTKSVNPIIDTGCGCDAVLEPKEFQLELQQQKAVWTNEFTYPSGYVRCTARFDKAVFGGETYTNLFIDRAPAMVAAGRTYYINAIGLPFLARHLVTLDFPKRTMYLKRRSPGPPANNSAPP
jgi:Aspartyl protease